MYWNQEEKYAGSFVENSVANFFLLTLLFPIEFLDDTLHIVSSYDKLVRRGFADRWVHEWNLI